MKVLLGGYLLVFFTISVVDCGPSKSKRTLDEADLEGTFTSPNGNTYVITDDLLVDLPTCVQGVEKAQEAKKSKAEEATTSQANQSTVLKSPYILKIDIGEDIDNEVNFLTALGKKDGFPELIEHGQLPHEQNSAVRKFYIMTRFGSSLYSHYSEKNKDYTVLSVRDIILDALHLFQAMHEAKFVHWDVKPDNMCLTENPNSKYKISLIDFGLARRLVDTGHGWFVEEAEEEEIGTHNYMSRAAHAFERLSAQSDIESLAYTILFFQVGFYWEYENGCTNEEILDQKNLFWSDEKNMREFLDVGGLPFLPFFKAVEKLVPGQPVNYEHLRQTLASIR